ncbi:MAG: hypothetical protein H0U75_05405 [Legionella sp.]|nr:hypothetical protein [Legionella sp.]
MYHRIVLIIISFLISPLNYAVSATPWLTGPLLAASGHTIPRGHTNFEMYGLDIFTHGRYDEAGRLRRTPTFRTFVANPVLTHGFTDWMDVQLVVPYVFNNTQGQGFNNIGDVSTAIGFQILEQKNSFWKTDLRFTIEETFPTGHFERLNSTSLGTDSTGLGNHQTQFSLNFQKLTQIQSHFLRTRLILDYVYFGPASVHGRNSYGGDISTNGIIDSSSEIDADLAIEYGLTQNWVLVMEGYVSQGDESRFNGVASSNLISGPPVNIGSGAFFEAALAPAIEYNFTSNLGLIGGVWFPVRSRNTADFIAYVLALNVFW